MAAAPHLHHEADPVDVRAEYGQDNHSRERIHNCQGHDAYGMAARVAANDTRQMIRDDNCRQYVSGCLASRQV